MFVDLLQVVAKDEDEDSMAAAMGFASFGTNKRVAVKKEKVKEMRAYEAAKVRRKIK